jgi:hypothetical protein
LEVQRPVQQKAQQPYGKTFSADGKVLIPVTRQIIIEAK